MFLPLVTVGSYKIMKSKGVFGRIDDHCYIGPNCIIFLKKISM